MKKTIFVVLMLVFFDLTLSGQTLLPPGWTPAPNLLYNMQVIAKLKYQDGSASLNVNDRIGAFAGDICRGVCAPDPALSGKIFLTVGSNQQSGEAISFRAYLSEPEQVIDLDESLVFLDQEQVGTVSTPFLFQCPATVPDTLQLQNITVGESETFCYEAVRLIVTAGNNTYLEAASGGTVNMGAGVKITMLPGTHFNTGSRVHAVIYPGGGFCNSLQSKNGETPGDSVSKPTNQMEGHVFFRIFPNPGSGRITLELTDSEHPLVISEVAVYNFLGEKVFSNKNVVLPKAELDLSILEPGLYFIRVGVSERIGAIRLIIL